MRRPEGGVSTSTATHVFFVYIKFPKSGVANRGMRMIIMKKSILLFAMMVYFSINVNAEEREVINYLSAASNICTPVTVKCNKGTFQVYHDETVIYGNLLYIEAWDCQGRKIVDTDADSYTQNTEGPYKRWFKFSMLYSETDSSTGNNESYTSRSNDNRYPSRSSNPVTSVISSHSDDLARAGADAMIDVFDKHVNEWGDLCKRFDISATYDSHIEGPAIGVQYRTPNVFGIFVRAGYNTHFDEYKQNLKKFRWTAGIQCWIKNFKILEFAVGESYYKKLGDTSYGLSMQIGWCQKIYKGLGIDGSLGFALSFKENGRGNPYSKFVWRAGLVYRFCLN